MCIRDRDIRIQIVELDLAEIPFPETQDLLEDVIPVVERKPEAADRPFPLLLDTPVHHAQLHHRSPAVPVEGMQQIEVKVIRIQPLQLSGEEALCVLQGLHLPGRQLGGQVIGLPGTAGEDCLLYTSRCV